MTFGESREREQGLLGISFSQIKRSETLENLTIETPEVGWWVGAKTGS
jgi:hypothetical protein